MKKALSLFLAVLMICSCMAIHSFAAVDPGSVNYFSDDASTPASYDQVVMIFDANGGTVKYSQWIYDTETASCGYKDNLTGKFAVVPTSYGTTNLTPGTYYTLPSVNPPSGSQFKGWHCYTDGRNYAADTYFIPTSINGQATAGTLIQFQAIYESAVQEENTSAKIIEVLARVFGAIIGILFYGGKTDAGIAFVREMLDGIFS